MGFPLGEGEFFPSQAVVNEHRAVRVEVKIVVNDVLVASQCVGADADDGQILCGGLHEDVVLDSDVLAGRVGGRVVVNPNIPCV